MPIQATQGMMDHSAPVVNAAVNPQVNSIASVALPIICSLTTVLQHLGAGVGFGVAGFATTAGEPDIGIKTAIVTFVALTALNMGRLLFFGFGNSAYSVMVDTVFAVGGAVAGATLGLVAN